MTKNETLITRCRDILDVKGERIFIAIPNTSTFLDTGFTTDDVIHLANELDRAEKVIAHYADKGNWFCLACATKEHHKIGDPGCREDCWQGEDDNGYNKAQAYFEGG